MEPLILLAVGGATLAYNAIRRSSRTSSWRQAVEGAAQQLGVRVEPWMGLRATIDGVPVTLSVRSPSTGARATVAVNAVLPQDAPSARLYVGWGVYAPPAELAHIPEIQVPGAARFGRRIFVRSDWPSLAELFIDAEVEALIAVRTAVPARAIEVLYRAGQVHVAAQQPPIETAALVRLVRETARLSRALSPQGGRTAPVRRAAPDTQPSPPASASASTSAASERATAPGAPAAEAAPTPPDPPSSAKTKRRRAPTPPPPRPRRPDLACGLCGERTTAAPDEAWSRCLRCDSPYHARCWHIATGCTAEGCVETRSLPF